jgi:hypothetical protein
MVGMTLLFEIFPDDLDVIVETVILAADADGPVQMGVSAFLLP